MENIIYVWLICLPMAAMFAALFYLSDELEHEKRMHKVEYEESKRLFNIKQLKNDKEH
jgi:hypothetical protein